MNNAIDNIYNFFGIINGFITNLRNMIEFNYDKNYCYFKKLYLLINDNDKTALIVMISVILIQSLLSYFNYYFALLFVFDYYLFLLFVNYRNNIRRIDHKSNLIKLKVIDYDYYDLYIGQWQGLREYMEDYYVYDIGKNIFCVIDGHGGDQIAKFMSEDFMFNHVITSFDNIGIGLDDIMKKSIIKYETITNNMKSGCVLSTIQIEHGDECDKLIMTNVGDTYVIVVNDDDSYSLINRQHTLYDYDEYLRYDRRIRLSSVMRTRTGLIPTRTIGDHSHKKRDDKLLFEPESKIVDLGNWKYILNCSDGIFDGIEIDDIINILNKYDNIDYVMREIQIRTTKTKTDLYDKIMGNFYGDNCTIIIIKNKKLKNKSHSR